MIAILSLEQLDRHLQRDVVLDDGIGEVGNAAIQHLIHMGSTGTNVNDLIIILAY